MNPKELRDLETALRGSGSTTPPLEFMAVHKENGKSMRVQAIDFDRRRVFIEESGYWNFSDCYLCQSTGYTDSEGEKVWNGDLVGGENKIGSPFMGVIVWKDYSWYVETCETHSMSWPLWEFDGGWACRLKRIGHIHIPSEWPKILSDSEVPDEVRRLLE